MCMVKLTYWTATMAHSHIAFNIQRWRSGKSERLHVGIDLRLEYSAVRPRAAESRDQFIVHRTSELINQLNAFRCAVVCIAWK